MELPAVGVDIEAVERFATVSERLFTQGELSHAGGRLDSRAGIWCAKEAVVKAVSKWKQLSLRQVEITYDGDRPTARVEGFEVDVSISHTADYAVAFAIAVPRT
jgi:holo-[acyl-carrier protein] synthase